MAAQISVQIEGGDWHNGVPCFEPFQEIAGTVEVTVDRSVECRQLAVRLMWHTEGSGDEDKATVQEADIYQGRLAPGYPVRGTFRLPLPGEPWSYTGNDVSIVWAIEVNVDVPMGQDLTHREPLVVRPRAAR